MISRLLDPLISVLYPHFCGWCGGSVDRLVDGAACRTCWDGTRIFGDSDQNCGKCGLVVEGIVNGSWQSCGQCSDHHYERAHAAGVYEKALMASVLNLKAQPYLSRTATRHLLNAFDRMNPADDLLIIPVPLSRRRNLERGFNQAAVLAKIIARHSGLPLDEHSLSRKQDTPMHRAAMDSKARNATVANVFEVVRPALIRGRNILLVDDVMTSGSTVSHCARVLKKNGAGKVVVLTLARAV